MKIKSQKRLQRRLNFYFRNFGIGKPYTILVDGTFCYAAMENRVPIKEQIPKYFDDERLRIVTTPCIIMEVEKLGKIKSNLHATWLIVKQFGIIKCGHEGKPVPAAECIQDVLKNNPNKYVLALQDTELKQVIQRVSKGTPILFLNRKTPVLAHPSRSCEEHVQKNYHGVSSFEENMLRVMKRKYIGVDQEEQIPKKKKVKKNFAMPHKSHKEPQQQITPEKKGRGRHRNKRQKMKKKDTYPVHLSKI
ncbi:Small subunit processome component [Halocaridina rubra]|uniref:rRNA-processing protein UTP23 homolog n=1 Tax=Halocaridina rubra TaxID=373956 RepID=A0AAN8WFI8_HALRR